MTRGTDYTLLITAEYKNGDTTGSWNWDDTGSDDFVLALVHSSGDDIAVKIVLGFVVLILCVKVRRHMFRVVHTDDNSVEHRDYRHSLKTFQRMGM